MTPDSWVLSCCKDPNDKPKTINYKPTLSSLLHFLLLLAVYSLRYLTIILLLGSLLFSTRANAQTMYTIKGMVYDSSRNYPMQYVNVFSTSGSASFTNAEGFYKIDVTEKDSIWFSYLGKATMKFPVMSISTPMQFDISLQVNVPVLREVRIRPKNYRQDSLQNREDYAKIFNYKKPGLKTVTPTYGAAAGFDLDEIINVFRFRRNRSMLSFQKRLLQQEEDKYVSHRFNKALVRRLTQLDSAALDSFMLIYRPSYLFTQLAGDYEFQLYIKTSYYRFRNGLPPEEGDLKLEDDK